MMESQDSTREAQTREEAAVLRAFELLEAGATPDPAEANYALVVEYLKTWTALPLELEPVTPRPEIKEALLRRLSEASPVRSVPKRAGEAPVVAFRRPGTGAFPRGYWALAAALVAAVIGLGLVSLNLSEKVQQQESALASLLLAAPLGHMEAELAAEELTYRDLPEPLFGNVSVQRSLFFQVSSADATRGTKANLEGGMLVCAKHRRWILNLQGLQPLGNDQQYHLWFVTDGGPVHVGLVQMAGDRTAQVSADRIPASVLGLLVSREGGNTVGAEPSGPILAQANRPVEI